MHSAVLVICCDSDKDNKPGVVHEVINVTKKNVKRATANKYCMHNSSDAKIMQTTFEVSEYDELLSCYATQQC